MKAPRSAGFAMCALCVLASPAWAGEGFQVRYNLAGTLGGEMFVPPGQDGLAVSLVYTHARTTKLTGNDGGSVTTALPGGTVPLPAPAPAALYPTYGPATGTVTFSGSLHQANLTLGYLTRERFANGRLAFGVNIPYVRKKQQAGLTAATPALNYSPLVPPATRAAVNTQFNTTYQAQLAARAASDSGEVSGLGDVELQGGWLYAQDRVRLSASTALVLPTGKYDAATGPDISLGNFYTLRPTVQAAWLATPDWALAGKVTAGFNTRNKDNDVRSGNWMGVEIATGYKTRVGVFGIQGVRVQQVQDDGNNFFGTSRYRSNNAGVFFTTRIPQLDTSVTLHYMATTSSRNARHGSYAQLRMIKVF